MSNNLSKNIGIVNSILKNNPTRAGIIPYYVNEVGDLLVYCMIPSDPAYGGSDPQMAKGKTDNMDAIDTAWKEAKEELGLVRTNISGGIKLLGTYPYNGDCQSDEIAVYYGKVVDSDKWNEPHYETGWSGWVNISLDIDDIRKNQRNIFKDLLGKV